jgi:hypothetical protein
MAANSRLFKTNPWVQLVYEQKKPLLIKGGVWGGLYICMAAHSRLFKTNPRVRLVYEQKKAPPYQRRGLGWIVYMYGGK